MSTDRTAIALIGAGLAGFMAATQPELIPALTLSAAAFVALLAYLKP